jgi:myo-inositol-1-phosphate synthase
MGAVATTFIAASRRSRAGLSQPIGSLTQMGTIRLGKRTDDRVPSLKDFVPLAELSQLEFAGWDPIADNAYEAAKRLASWRRSSSTKFVTASSPSSPCRRCSAPTM